MRSWKWGSIVAATVLVVTSLAVLTDATPVRHAESRDLAARAGSGGVGMKTPNKTKKRKRARNALAAKVPILVVGDSLEVGTGPHLIKRLGDRVQVFARRGRPSTEGLEVLRRKFRARHGVVVFDLGSNDDHLQPWILRENMREARRLITPRRCMVVATVNPERREPLNVVIRRVAERSNVVLFDWKRLTKRRPELLTEDRVHATPHGYAVRSRQLVRKIRECPVWGPRRR
jgi:hypothetical protein